jgi:hypothetical protein
LTLVALTLFLLYSLHLYISMAYCILKATLYLKAQRSFSLGIPADVTSMAMRNSLKSIWPLRSESNVRKTFSQNRRGSPPGSRVVTKFYKISQKFATFHDSCEILRNFVSNSRNFVTHPRFRELLTVFRNHPTAREEHLIHLDKGSWGELPVRAVHQEALVPVPA